MQKLSVLIVCAELNWISTSRMPGALHHAGFDVNVLSPRDALITKSRFARRIGYFPNDCTYPFWAQTIATAVRTHSPALIVPGDDRTAALLHRVITDPPPGLVPALHARLAELIQRSLGDPRFFEVASNKFLLADAAIAAGVRVPDQRIAKGVAAALEAAREVGYPIALKREAEAGGERMRVAFDDATLARAVADAGEAPLLVQRYVRGQPATFGAVSLGGRFLAGLTAIRVPTDPPETESGTVVQIADRPDVAEAAATMIEVLGLSGFSSFEFVLEDGTGAPYLIECTPRISVASYIGTHFGADLSRELYQALAGARDAEQPAPPQRLREQTIALFPQEWLRSPQSPALRSCVIDAPWDDPELFAATIKGAGMWPG
jgi:glutathione synthase/RimK-type ligase-like ATP-grasp enzyme